MKIGNTETFVGPATTTVAETSSVTSDTFMRFTRTADGGMKWGSGAAAQDCGLNRLSTALMSVTGALTISTTLSVGTNLGVTDDASIGGSLSVFGGAGLGGGSGVLSMANASAPGSNPSGGGLLYAKQAVPIWKDTGGNFLGMVRTYDVNATSATTITLTEADITGASISVVVVGSNTTVIVHGTFDFTTTAASSTISGILSWNGSDRTQQAILGATATSTRGTVAQTWRITGVTAGTYVCKLRAKAALTGQTGSASVHTGMTVQVIEG